jgi:sigma-B regulation protein RsbU (phosphoserine phosphatase)
VGSLMGIALERARLFELVKERRIHEQAALLSLSNQLLSQANMGDLINCLVEEVQELLQAHACALLLPDEKSDSLAFYAASGWQVDPVAAGRRVPADPSSGSGRVMKTQEPLLITDVLSYDPTPWRADWLDTEDFRGHAVVPMVAVGRSIGVLMVDTRVPHQFTEDEVRFMSLMANQAAIAIEKARLHEEEIKRQRLEEEMAVGRQIQFSLLPEACPVVPGWEIATLYQPARLVGGDFYDLFELPGEPGRFGFVIADVADKGVPAALMMALSRTIIRTKAMSRDLSPREVLQRSNQLIIKDSRSKLFITAIYARLDANTGRLQYSIAGHNRPLWLKSETGICEELGGRGIVLGIFEDINLDEREVCVAPGDVLIFYTDGITEAMNHQHQLFGEERLNAVINAHPQADAQQLLDAIIEAVYSFTDNAPQSDDLTLLIIKRKNAFLPGQA